MALTIRFKNDCSEIFHTPFDDKDRDTFRTIAARSDVNFIIADGHEGAACIRAYQRMTGAPQMMAEAIGYYVCYSGDIAASVLLNLAYGG